MVLRGYARDVAENVPVLVKEEIPTPRDDGQHTSTVRNHSSLRRDNIRYLILPHIRGSFITSSTILSTTTECTRLFLPSLTRAWGFWRLKWSMDLLSFDFLHDMIRLWAGVSILVPGYMGPDVGYWIFVTLHSRHWDSERGVNTRALRVC